MRHYNIPIFIPHLACPFRCIFCDQKIISAQKKVPTPDDLQQIVARVLSTIPPSAEVEIAFFGGNFTAIDKERQGLYLKAVQPYLQRGQVKGIRVSTRPDCLDPSELAFLASYGVQVIELGIQSFCDEVLTASQRGYTAEKAAAACQLVKKSGFKLGIQLMPGLPGDNRERISATTERTIELKPDMVRIYPTVVLAGTELAEMMARGEYQPLTVEEAVEISADMFMRFQRQGIDVIRVGLHNGEDLQDEGNIKGGAYHPALGELVEQAVFYRQTLALLKSYPYSLVEGRPLLFTVNKKDISKFVGYRKRNLKALQPLLAAQAVIKGVEATEGDWIALSQEGYEDRSYVLSRQDFLNRYWQ